MGNNSSARGKLGPVVLTDLAQSTEFSEAEIKQWYKDFQKDFPNGFLSIDQFKEVYSQNFPNGDATKFAEYVFKTFDTDGDRNLDFREFMIALSVTARGGPKERLRWAFQMYDINDDGSITKDECTHIIKALYKLLGPELSQHALEMTPEERTDHVYELIDANRDGVLSLEEFVNGANMDPVIVQMLSQNKF